jgi:hypothetical protein
MTQFHPIPVGAAFPPPQIRRCQGHEEAALWLLQEVPSSSCADARGLLPEVPALVAFGIYPITHAARGMAHDNSQLLPGGRLGLRTQDRVCKPRTCGVKMVILWNLHRQMEVSPQTWGCDNQETRIFGFGANFVEAFSSPIWFGGDFEYPCSIGSHWTHVSPTYPSLVGISKSINQNRSKQYGWNG